METPPPNDGEIPSFLEFEIRNHTVPVDVVMKNTTFVGAAGTEYANNYGIRKLQKIIIIHTDAHSHVYTYLHYYIYTYTRSLMYVHIPHLHIYIHPLINICAHIYTYIYTCTYTPHTYAHTFTHTKL